jgi:putative membrane protein
VLILVLGAFAGAYVCAAMSSSPPSRPEQACFAAGWTILCLALISPLCSLSVALFSARVGQHVVLTLVAAPLIVMGRGEAAIVWTAPRLRGLVPATTGFAFALFASAAFALALWTWHVPRPYAATF